MDLNDALKTFITIAQHAAERKPEPHPDVLEHNDRSYVVQPGGGLKLLTDPRPQPLEVNSLDAVEAYIKSNRDALDPGALIVHVESAARVSIVSAVDPIDAIRTIHLRATPPVPAMRDTFGQYLEAETFVVTLQTAFAESPERDDLLALVGTMQSEDIGITTDDGLAQQVTTRRGVKPTRETVKNPYRLIPLRSFPEVELEPVPFVVRFKREDNGTPKVALFEADGGRWVLDALAKIKAYLEPRLEGTNVALIC
jgi:hypothetical protein